MAGGRSLARILYDGAAIDPSAIAVEDGDATITFEELIARVEVTGAALQQGLSVPASRVALCAANSVDHLVAYLAILVSGFVWVPLNPANGRSLNTKIAAQARPDLVLCDRASRDAAPGTDHTREYVPAVIWSKVMREGVALGDRQSFADIAATLSDVFGLPAGVAGQSFVDSLKPCGGLSL